MDFGLTPGLDMAASVKALGVDPKRDPIRTYQPGQLQTALSMGFADFCHSTKADLAAVARQDKPTVDAIIAEWKKVISGEVSLGHETNNDPAQAGKTDLKSFLDLALIWQGAWGVVLRVIMPAVNAGRDAAHTLIPVPIVTSSVFQLPGGMEPWYVKGVKRLGFDDYDPANFTKCHAYVQTKLVDGVDSWGIYETGYVAQPTTTAVDPQKAARLRSDFALYGKFKLPPRRIFIYMNGGSNLIGCPISLAAWNHAMATGVMG